MSGVSEYSILYCVVYVMEEATVRLIYDGEKPAGIAWSGNGKEPQQMPFPKNWPSGTWTGGKVPAEHADEIEEKLEAAGYTVASKPSLSPGMTRIDFKRGN